MANFSKQIHPYLLQIQGFLTMLCLVLHPCPGQDGTAAIRGRAHRLLGNGHNGRARVAARPTGATMARRRVGMRTGKRNSTILATHANYEKKEIP